MAARRPAAVSHTTGNGVGHQSPSRSAAARMTANRGRVAPIDSDTDETDNESTIDHEQRSPFKQHHDDTTASLLRMEGGSQLKDVAAVPRPSIGGHQSRSGWSQLVFFGLMTLVALGILAFTLQPHRWIRTTYTPAPPQQQHPQEATMSYADATSMEFWTSRSQAGLAERAQPMSFISTSSSPAHPPIRFESIPYDPRLVSQLRWGIVFDAGSTGSRVHIYRFRLATSNKQKQTQQTQSHQPILEDEIFAEVKPGLSAYVPSGVGSDSATLDVGASSAPVTVSQSESNRIQSGAKAAASSLDPLLALCRETIPEEVHGKVPIALRATAGLRLLGAEASEAILQEIRRKFRDPDASPFKMEDPLSDVQVMDGSEEGVFAWITVNYLTNQLGEAAPYTDDAATQPQRQGHERGDTATATARPSKLTSAIMDLGGASTQLVFEPDPTVVRSLAPSLLSGSTVPAPVTSSPAGATPSLYPLAFGSRFYQLYEKSYLGYGLMEARRRMKDVFVATLGTQSINGIDEATTGSEEDLVAHNPCLSDTYEEAWTWSPTPTAASAGSSSSTSPKKKVLLKGTAQGHDSCASIVKTLFPKHEPCPHDHLLHAPAQSTAATATTSLCSFGGHFALPLSKSFLDAPRHGDSHSTVAAAPSSSLSPSPSPSPRIYAFSYLYDRTIELFDFDETAETEEGLETGTGQIRPKSSEASNNLTPTPTSMPLSRIKQLAQAICSFSMRKHQSTDGRSPSFAPLIESNPHLCFDLTYSYTLLSYGYDLPDSTSLSLMKRIGGKELGWCLGAMLAIMEQQQWT